MNIERRVLSQATEGSGVGKTPQGKPKGTGITSNVKWDYEAYERDILAHKRMREARKGASTRGPEDWTAPQPPIDLYKMHYGGMRDQENNENRASASNQKRTNPNKESMSRDGVVPLDGAKISELRKQKNIPQLSLARRIDTTQGTISRLEHGKTGLGISSAEKIAEALGVSLQDILRQDS